MGRLIILCVLSVAAGVLVRLAAERVPRLESDRQRSSVQLKEATMNLTTQKVIRVGLVGHCTPDSSHLTMAISGAIPGAKVIRVTDDAGTDKLLADGVDLLLVNRAMEHGYSEAVGTDYIRKLKAKNPAVKMMLISNYADAQDAAVKEGALPGFGKNAIMAAETKKKLQDAVK